MRLGGHSNDCLGNVTLCPDGTTLSLWFKLESQVGNWAHLLQSTLYFVLCQTFGSNYFTHIYLRNETHDQHFSDFPPLSYGTWYHLGITYQPHLGYEVYIDGCLPVGHTKNSHQWTPAIQNFQLGCDYGNKCMKVFLDDLRFWTAKKSHVFMYWLWKMYE